MTSVKLTFDVIAGTVLGVKVYRGYARLCDLAVISRADIYDPKTNPTGTQRDLSPKHAKDAYDYVKTNELGFWPEVFLCARDPSAISFKAFSPNGKHGELFIDMAKVENGLTAPKIAISRVDGNHRLHYADGATKGYPMLEKQVSFCLAYGLKLDEEISLFRDINNNQKRMNTSHLDKIEVQLSPEEKLQRENPALYIAQELGRDKDSPLYERIYAGGKKGAASLVPLRTLRTGIEYMLSRPTKLTALPGADARYKVIRNYFEAVKKWVPDSWSDPQKYLVLRGAGLWGICFLGAEVIDRAMSKEKFKADDLLKVLTSGRKWDWSNDGDFKGYSGRGGAVKIRDAIVSEFSEESGVSVKALYKKIMEEK